MSTLENVIELHRRIDIRIAPLLIIHADRLNCRQTCCACCVDDITVFEVEADVIRHCYSRLLETALPHRIGRCAFLDEQGNCRIYAHRPYVCRTQGLPLRWIEEDIGEGDEPEIFEYRDICPENEEGTAIEELDEDACWTLGPVEGELAALQKDKDGGRMHRVRLRDLFG